MRRLAFLLRPGWLVYTVITAALIVTMIELGFWQLRVSDRKHFDLQNFGYVLQWWAFSAFVFAFWARAVMLQLRPPKIPHSAIAELPDGTPAPVAYRRYVMPQLQQTAQPQDAVEAAYNEQFARLAKRDGAHD